MMDYQKILLLTWAVMNIFLIEGKLRDVLNYYETLRNFNVDHRIVRRSINNGAAEHISFKSHGEEFRLNLVPSKQIFDPLFEAVSINSKGVETPVNVNKDNFYQGFDELHEKTEVIAHLQDGIMSATIVTKNETFFIEPKWRHEESSPNEMIIYKSSDVIRNLTHGALKATCGVNETFNSENIETYKGDVNSAPSRIRRNNEVNDRNVCDLVLVADYLFFKHMGGSNKAATINYMLQVADRVNRLYRNTYWDDVGTNIGFQVKKAIVYDEYSEDEPRFNQKKDLWNVDTLLRQFSYQNWQGSCLAHLFTYQDFARGVIGLAYVASPSLSMVGGICTSRYQDKVGWRYLNSGLSSSLNWNRRLLTIEADLVTAHEFGHNFGSGHDPNSCAPSTTDGGKYIMYATSVSGERPNNKLFSSCSRKSIGLCLRSKRRLCFKNQQNNFCGNGIVEDKEICDSGFSSNDKCCNSNCQLKSEAFQCSDANDPCCKNCMVAPTTVVCRDKSEISCDGETTCDGRSKSCPKDSPPLSGNECGFSRGNCDNGKCKPLCALENPPRFPCSCSAGETSCRICCRSLNSTSSECVPLKTNAGQYISENDGIPCFLSSEQGQCIGGECKKSQQNVEDEFSSLLKDFTFSKFARFMEANIVGTILVFSLMIWIPAGCIVHYIDKKSDEENEQMKVWQSPRNKEFFQKISSEKFKQLFRPGGGNKGVVKKYPRSQYHISS